ncbi:MAG: M28 family peptidase [Elusimicrobia bacterium]|nr:M28 family peptidase [Elusimicrobiota bacterium]
MRKLAALAGAGLAFLAALGLALRQPTWSRKAGPGPEADPARLERDTRRLSRDFLPRDAEHRENLDRASAFIKAELEAAGGEVSEQVFGFSEFDRRNRAVERGPYRNVLAVFGPDTPEKLVVGAHYDAYGPHPGADDNASGVAGLLELARLLQKDPPRLRTELAAYTLEEPPYFATPHMGSARHAAALRRDGVRIRAMISLEMIGTFSDAAGSQRYPMPLLRLFYPGRGDFIAVVGALPDGGLARRVKTAMRRPGLPVYSINALAFVPGVDYSDHASFWEAGYPAVMVTDTAFYRNPRYHKPGDSSETLDYGRMARTVSGVRAAVLSFAP